MPPRAREAVPALGVTAPSGDRAPLCFLLGIATSPLFLKTSHQWVHDPEKALGRGRQGRVAEI